MDVRTGDARSYLSKFTIEVVQMAIVETSKVTTTPIATGTWLAITAALIRPRLVITSAEDLRPNTK